MHRSSFPIFIPSIDLSALDWAVLLGYFTLVVVIGFIAARSVRGTSGYFLGNRRFGKKLLLVNLLHLRRGAEGFGLKAYRADLIGFVIGWGAVAVLVGLLWLLVNL